MQPSIPPSLCLNKENYVPWSSLLLRCLQTNVLGLPEDIYAAVDSCETAQEIWLRVQQMMKGSDIGIQEKKAKLFNEWERNKHFPEKIASNLKFLNNLQPEWSRHVTIVHQTKDLHTTDYTQLYDFLKYNQKEVDDQRAERLAKTHDPLALMANVKQSFNYYSYPHRIMNMALALMAKAFKLNYSTPTNNNQRISSNPRNRQIAQQRQYAVQNVGSSQMEYNAVQNVGNQNIGNGNVVAARAEGNAPGNNDQGERDMFLQTQLLIAQKEEAGIQLQAEEFDLMAAAADLDEIEEVNANCILMANLQQASTSGTQTDKAPVYDSDGSAEVHNYDNCYDNEIFNMFTQEEQYTEILEPIPEPHQVQQNDNVISDISGVEQEGGSVDQHTETIEETRVTLIIIIIALES
ncbi:hypothetical protein Tco_1001037 [Tanacetum coccineum]